MEDPLDTSSIIPDGYKRCGACREIKPATTDFFYASRTIKSGLQGKCIACVRKPKPNIPEGHKRCAACRRDLPANLSYFDTDKRKKDGLRQPCKECRSKQGKQDRQEHPEKRLAYEAAYRKANREQLRANDRRYAQSAKGRQNAIERQRRHRQNPGVRERQRMARMSYYWLHYEQQLASGKRYREAHPGHMRELNQAWAKAHPELLKVYRARRRARLLAASGEYTAQDVKRQYARQKGQCYYCHKKVKNYHVDHVIPLSRGGSNGPENIVIACQPCNNRKSNKFLHEWPDGGRLL